MKRINHPFRIEDITKIITYLIGAVGFLSVYTHISFLYSSLFLLLYISSIYLDYRRFFIPRWAVNAASLMIVGLYFFRMSLDNLVVPALESLLFMLSIKFLEEKRFRDYMQIYMITVFLLSGSALMSLNMIFLAYFLILIFLITIAIVMLTYYSEDKDMILDRKIILKIISKSLLIPFLSIPMTILMFIILPRTSYPILDFLNKGGTVSTGFSDRVKLGDVSDIQEDTTVIFRANMERIADDSLYWRGIVLDYFDGISWRASEEKSAQKGQLRVTGRKVPQTIYLEPYGNKYLFGIDKPVSLVMKNAHLGKGLTITLNENISRRIRYEAVSIISDYINEEEIESKAYLQVPEKGFEKTRQLSQQFGQNSDEMTTAKEILKFLRNGQYRYSLKDLPITPNPLEDFLFDHKYGNCEYFASSMAVMLRMAGIPSRLIGGYLGGYYNDTGKYYMVTQRNAHVWVEAYIDGRWLRFDPTPVIMEDFISYRQKDMLIKIRFALDTINYYWNSIVIGYDLEKQFSIIEKIRTLKKPEIDLNISRRDVIKYSIIVLVILSCVLILRMLFINRKPLEDRIIEEFNNKLKSAGYMRSESEGLEEFASRIKDEEIKTKTYEFIKRFEGIYYRDMRLSHDDAKYLRAIIKSIRIHRKDKPHKLD